MGLSLANVAEVETTSGESFHNQHSSVSNYRGVLMRCIHHRGSLRDQNGPRPPTDTRGAGAKKLTETWGLFCYAAQPS